MASTKPELIADSLFQVNLLLWMLQSPNKTNVRALFHEAGYRLYAVERELLVPVELHEKLKRAGIASRRRPQPDMVLVADGSEFLLVECKRKMFGATTAGDDGHLKQARSYLLQTPDVLKESLGGVPVSASHLAYLCRHEAPRRQSDGIKALEAEMNKAGVKTISKCIIRLSSSTRGMYIEPVCAGDVWPRP